MDRPPPSPAEFPTTRWSLVYRAGHPAPTSEREAGSDPLAQLLTRYLPVLKAYLVMSRRLRPEEADDALQDFVLDKVIRQRLLTHADERKGRFRGFLLTVLNRYLIDRHRRRQHAPDTAAANLDAVAEAAAPPDGDVFDAEWARSVVAQAIAATQTECLDAGRTDLWRILDGRVLRPAYEAASPTPYEELASELGLKSPAQMSNLLVTAKRMFVRNLRSVVEPYCRDPAEVEREIAELRATLARAAQDGGGGGVEP